MAEHEQSAGTSAGRGRGSRLLGLAMFAGATTLSAILGGASTRAGKGLWYGRLRKPPGTPPSWVFGPVWTTLYAMMAASAYRVWRQPPSHDRSAALRVWWTQMVLNGAWSPLFFAGHRPRLALVDLVGLAGAIIGYMRRAHRVDPPAAYLMAPYLAWVGYAGYLNAGIAGRNRA